MEILRCENLTKVYGAGDTCVRALDGVSFSVEAGEFVSIVGPSGSGKSTLLHILGGVDKPTEGKVWIGGTDIHGLSENRLAVFRRRQVGLIYQFYNLLPVLNVEENIVLPHLLDGRKLNRERLDQVVKSMGLEDRKYHLPKQLSGGQQQRVSIGRALYNHPAILLADEPTGNLDRRTGEEIIAIMKRANREMRQTQILITHDERIALQADRMIWIEDGRILRDERIRVIGVNAVSKKKEPSFKTKDHKNIVYYVTMQYMKKNRKRTATTFAGIVLMALLMTCVFVGRDTGIGYLEDVASIKKGKYHAAMYGVTRETYEEVSRLSYVMQTAGSVQFGSTAFDGSANKERPFLNVKGYTAECYDWMNISLYSGRLPENDTEIVISKSALDDGAQIKAGDQVEAEFFERSLTGTSQDGGTTYFPFSGLSLKSGQTLDVPENFPFYEENDSFRENHDYTGEKRVFIVTGIIDTPAYESSSAAGYTALTTLTTDQVISFPVFNVSMIFDQKILPPDFYQRLKEQFPKCEVGLNNQVLAFSANSSDTTMNLVVQYMTVLFTALIMTVSAVLICNVFQMSFQERSRYLGMLCSVGATGQQKRSSIYYEAFYLLLFALPLGIVLGIGVIWGAMTFFRPMLLEFMNLGYGVEAIPVQVKISLKNLAVSATMSGLTVLLSAFLPARKIGRIGPLESIRGNTKRRSRPHRTSVRAIRLSGAEGLLAWNTMTRSGQKVRAVSRAAAAFLVLLSVTAFGAASLHQAMEKRLVSSGLTANQESYDYALYASGEAIASGAYEALKKEIAEDSGVENVREWYSAMFAGDVAVSVYSDEYWDAVYDIMNAYHHGALSREEFEKEWRQETRPVNMLSVDEKTFQEMAKICGADTGALSDHSAIVLGEGEFSTDNVGVMGMEPDRYRYYRMDNMTSLKSGDEFSVRFYSD